MDRLSTHRAPTTAVPIRLLHGKRWRGTFECGYGELDVVATNRAPVAVGDSYSTNEDTSLTVAAPGVLNGDSDPDGDPLSAAVVTGRLMVRSC